MKAIFYIPIAFCSFACIACNEASVSDDSVSSHKESRNLDSLNFSVAEAPEWSALFHRKKGWFGGDGIFCVTKDGKEITADTDSGEVLFWFSDSMIGEIKDSLQPGSEMINNSVATLKPVKADSSAIRFYWNKKNGKNGSVFVPSTPASQKGDYYWLGDGFVNHAKNNDLYIFGYRIQNTGAAVFGFKEVGNTLIVVPAGSRLPFTTNRQVDIPFFLPKDSDTAGTIGCGIYVNTREAGAQSGDGYLYVYGLKGKNKQVIVARVKPAEIETFAAWRFWDGLAWNEKVTTAMSIADRASNELSVTRLSDGRYALVFQEDGIGKHVAMRLGRTPYGPFGGIIRLWDCSKDINMDKDFICYNAKAHPVLSQSNELVISYNINSFDFANDIKRYPNLYRPRFIKVKIQQ
jgi:uncharacterized protein DUF4185